MKLKLIVILTLAVYACKNDSAGEQEATVTKTDLKGVLLDSTLMIDSVFVSGPATNDTLSYEDIRRNKGNISEVSKVQVLKGFIDDFCMIDSLKRIGKYAEYLDSLDIGMTQDATIDDLGWISMKNGADIHLWRMQFSSYEACPLFTGTCVVGSLSHGTDVSHVVLGKLFYWADPPNGFEEKMTSEIHDDWIGITTTSIEKDFDVPTEKKNTECYTVRITSNGAGDPEPQIMPAKVP